MTGLALTLAVVNAILATERALAREELLWRTFQAVCWVESRGDPRAHNKKEQAVGIAQITPICLKDINRVLGKQKYKPDDRLCSQKSWQMFRIYCRYYQNKGGPEQWARLWNSGPNWKRKTHLTDGYWEKVKKVLDSAPLRQPGAREFYDGPL